MRIDVGGNLLTNYLKELVSYRQLNLMDEYLVCHRMKELGCYCTLDFKELFENILDLEPYQIPKNSNLSGLGAISF